MVSKHPMFANKTEFVQQSSLILGADTYVRLIDKVYYKNDPSLLQKFLDSFITQSEIKVILAPRISQKPEESSEFLNLSMMK